MGKIAIEEMRRYGYDLKLACGCVAAGGLLGIMIPPSIILVLYGVITEESIGKLLMAGFLPGFLTAAVFIAGITLLVIRNPKLAPRTAPAPMKERLRSLKGGIGILVLMASVLGTLYAGVLTPTEAGAFGAFVAFLFLIIRNPSWKTFVASIKESSQITSTIFGIIVGASIFGKFLVLAKVPLYTSRFMIGLEVSPLTVLLLIVLVYLLLGMFLDPVSILVLTLPLFYPVVTKIGYDGIWFGIFVTLMIEVGLVTPPVGFNVFVIKSIAPDVPLEDVFRGVGVFIVMMMIVLVLLVMFPQIALWLPGKLL
jgi:tripartite ATP-independent transporter DctM subunit